MRRLLCTGSLILAATAICSVVSAADATNRVNKATDVTTNAPIVVTASRAERTAQEMPANVRVITDKEIRNVGAQDLVVALETLGGIYFRKNSDNPSLADISMGGFGENSFGRVLVLVDGQRLNGADQSTLDWLRVPIGAVERIEVLRGGETALYGDYAEAGVINIITHQPSGTPVTTVSVMGGSDGAISAHVGHEGSISNVYYTADVDWHQSNGYRQNSAYQNLDVRGSVLEDWTDRFSTKVSAFYSRNALDLPGGLTNIVQMRQDPRQTNKPLDDGNTTTFGENLNCLGQIGSDGHLDFSVAATHRTTYSNYYSEPSYYSPYSSSTLDTIYITPRYTLDTDIGGFRNRSLVGMDMTIDSLSLFTYTSPSRTINSETFDARLNRLASDIYAQDEFFLTRELSLILGGRVGWCRYNSDLQDLSSFPVENTDGNRTFHQGAWDAALMYHPTSALKLFARFATLYHDPLLDEMTGAYGGGSMNTALKPELSQEIQLGSSLSIAKEWTADLSLYRMDMRDEIDYNPITIAESNMDPNRRYGINAALTWQRQNVGLISCAYDYVNARFSSGAFENRTVPLVPENVITVRGELDLPFDLAALATVHAVTKQFSGDDYVNEYPTLPGYGTLDLGLRYHPHQIRNLDILVGVDNVFDHIYANSGYNGTSYYPAPGRTWKVGASYRF